MADFPTYLNKCLVDSYSYKDSSNEIISTGMESGNNRLRQRSKKIPSIFSAIFIFDQDQLSVFEYFNQNVLFSRTQRFNIYLKTGATQQLFDVKYFAAPQISVVGTQKYKVDCQFESSNRQMISTTPTSWFAFYEDPDPLGDGFGDIYDISIGGNWHTGEEWVPIVQYPIFAFDEDTDSLGAGFGVLYTKSVGGYFKY